MKKIYQITIVIICLSILFVSAFFSDDTLNESDDNTTENDVIADNDSQMGEKYTADIDSQLVLLSDYFNKCLDEYYKYNHFPQNLHFAIVDLNRNGRLELIITDIMGSGHFSITCFYEVSDDYQTLDMMKTAETSNIPEDIDYSYVDGIGDFLYYEELECFKKDNKYYYLLSDATSAGLGCMFGEAFYSYSFDGMVEKDKIGTYVLSPYNDNTDRIKINFYSKYGGLETEEKYLHFMSSYWYGYEKQPNTSIKWIYLSDNQDIGSAIIESYNGFNTNAVCEKAEDYDYRDIYGNDCEYVTEFVLFRTDTKDFGFLTLVGERNPNPNILVQYNESEFSLGESFVNNYSEYPQAAAWDVDDDGEDEIIISLREYTGNLSTYRLFVCDKEDDIYKKYEFKDFGNLINKEISYSYDSNSDIFEFQTPKGKIQFNMPSWSKEYPYDGNVIYNHHFYFDCENMKLIVTPEINMKNSVPFTPIKMTFNITYKEGKFELQYESYEEIEKIIMNSNEENSSSDIENQVNILLDSSDYWELSEETVGDFCEKDDCHEYGYTITDLDEDGFLEVIKSLYAGNGHFSRNSIYEITEDGKIVQWDNSELEKCYSQPDLLSMSEIIIYDNSSDSYRYYTDDFESWGVYGYANRYGIMEILDNTIKYQEIYREEISYSPEENNISFFEGDRELTEKQYNEKVDDKNIGSNRKKLKWFTEISFDNIKDSYEFFASE